ncbi:hypothetical protein EVAR_50743_1 [Eumeta japonica]|uniref:Cysteine/serine-rich nuclear protein N-terminal domain-containing protein n=1 Tax=Eumeta variegata TaxID=151549 RepID=A0A4C1Y4R1_EUMVA|nr:hypothetical protein EVAR_50743_1 [Eumeta japonica]
MDDTSHSVVVSDRDLEHPESNNYHDKGVNKEDESHEEEFSVIKEENSNDGVTSGEEICVNDDHVDSIHSSQFYEGSDSKINYAVKMDDNDTLSDIDDIKTDTASADSEDSALGSLPPDLPLNDREEDGQSRSDGSDSGLGSETTEDIKLPSFSLDLPCASGRDIPEAEKENLIKETPQDNIAHMIRPTRSNLKRKFDDVSEAPGAKRKRESIKFDNVTVYYFPRAQGFTCVPSQGGSTLGMEWTHTHLQKFTLPEHAMEQRRLHRQILQQLKNERHSIQGAALSSSEDSDTEEETSDISESELDLDSYYFLQPVPTRQRRALLRAAGVRKIEGYEKDECRDIRTSREFCGCACKGICNQESCSCSLAGIKCQVDRLNFPCGCTRDGCNNSSGRIEFNPVRVRTHFINTLMRLGLERKHEETLEAKRKWEEENGESNKSSCMSYQKNQGLSTEDGLLRDVTLTPRVEVESCVNSGSFSNVHGEVMASQVQSDIGSTTNYGYDNNILHHNNLENVPHIRNASNINNHADPYTSGILQGKGPPYPTNSIGFNSTLNNAQRFPCEMNYNYNHHPDSRFKSLQSFSASSFEEFAHNSHMSMFSHYGHMYAPDYLSKPNSSMHDHNLQYHSISTHSYMYKPVPDGNQENKESDSYTTLMSLPYQSCDKLEMVQNDENWYSHNTLLNLDHDGQTTQDATELHAPSETTSENNSDGTENFGELIKKTMVESVTV